MPAHGRAAINALANIHRCGGEKEAALGWQLAHERVSTKARTNATSGCVDAGERMDKRVPAARCSATWVVGVAWGHEGTVGTSTTPRSVEGAAICFVRSVIPNRPCLATREGGNAEGNATA